MPYSGEAFSDLPIHNTGYCNTFDSRERKEMFASLKNLDEEKDDDGEEPWTVDVADLEAAEDVQQ